MELTAGLIVITMVAVLVYHYRDHAIFTRAVKYPSPNCLPLIGNIVELLKHTNDINSFVTETSVKLGLPWVIHIPFRGVIFYILDYENYDYILKNPYIFEKGDYFKDKLQQALGDGVFNTDGQKWKVQRKIASTLFTSKNFRELFVPIFEKNLEQLDKLIEDNIKQKKPVNILAMLGKYALDSFSEVSCGKTPIESKNFKEGSSFEKSFEKAQAIIDQRFRIPFWKVYEWVTGVAEQMRECLRILDKFVYTIIDERRRDVEAGIRSKHEDLLDKFMAVKLEDGSNLSKEELKSIMLSLLVAGRDTTSQAITWLLLYLVKDKRGPLIVEKILEEFDYFCPDGKITYDVAKDKLYIFQAVFYETLRLFPPVPKNMKSCSRDAVLPNGKLLLKKGDFISISPFASARMTENWGPLATKFLPERWLHNVDDIANVIPSQLQHQGDCPRILSVKDPRFIAFNSGPRRCVGSEFALVEAIIVGIHLLKKYVISLNKNDHAYDFVPGDLHLLRKSNGETLYLESLTMPKKGGLILDMEYRDNNFARKHEKREIETACDITVKA